MACILASTFAGVGSTGVASALSIAPPTDLGTLPGGTGSIALVASSSVVGGYSYVAGDTATHAFVYDLADPSPHMIDLGTLGGTSSSVQQVDGRLVVGFSDTAVLQQQGAFVYDLDDDAPLMVDIGSLGGRDTYVDGLSGGVITGSSQTAAGELHAFVYDVNDPSPHMIDLGTFGGAWSEAISVSGRVVAGGAETAAGETHAFAYDLDDPSPHMIDLGALGGSYAVAYAVSGSIVAGLAATGTAQHDGPQHAFAYDLNAASPHMIDLGDLGTHDSAVVVTGVHDSFVAGYATAADRSGSHAWAYDLSAASPHMLDLGTLGGSSSRVLGGLKSNVLVGLSDSAAGDRAFAVDLSAFSPHMIDLGTLGGTNSYAYGASETGLVVGQAALPSGVQHAAMWQTSPSTDSIGPAITVTTPIGGGEFTRGQVVPSAYSCNDGIDGSGIASCVGTVASGSALDTATAGSHVFTVDAIDGVGNLSSTSVSYMVLAGNATQNVSGGETVSTDPGGVGASPSIPIQTTIVVPADVSGPVTVTPQAAGAPPAGYTFFGHAVVLTGPTAPNAADPYLATFTIDGSVLGPIDLQDLQVFRNDTPVLDCTDAATATPDPCVVERGAVGDSSDDAFMTVRTTQFSTWTIGRRAFSISRTDPTAAPRGTTHTSVAIVGTGFVAGSTATIPGGGVTVNSTTFVDGSHLLADVSIASGAALGTRNVQVRRSGPPATTSTCVGCFTVNPKPTITSLSPAALPQGAILQYVTITGTDFASGASVTFGGADVGVHFATGAGTSMTVYVSVSPTAALGTRSVTVTNPDGGFATKNNALTVVAKPTATSLVPSAAPQGKTLNVQIIGTSFPANFVAAGGTVSFGSPSIIVNTVTRNSATKLTANITIPGSASLGPRDAYVTNADGGQAVCSSCFTVTEPPRISSVAPSSRGQGTSSSAINITGSGFQIGVAASISGGGVTVNSVQRQNATALTLAVTVASGAATTARNVIVTNPDASTSTCTGCFTVNPKPTIATASPNSRAAGASYTIAVNGTALQDGASVLFSGTGIQVNSVSRNGTSLNVDIAIANNAALGNRSVTVTNPDGGTATKANAFKVLAAH